MNRDGWASRHEALERRYWVAARHLWTDDIGDARRERLQRFAAMLDSCNQEVSACVNAGAALEVMQHYGAEVPRAPRVVLVGLFPDPELVNAWVASYPEGDIVFVSEGLIERLHDFIQVVFASTSTAEVDGAWRFNPNVDGALLDSSHALELMQHIFAAGARDSLNLPAPDESVRFFQYQAMCFVVAHEQAHSLLGHTAANEAAPLVRTTTLDPQPEPALEDQSPAFAEGSSAGAKAQEISADDFAQAVLTWQFVTNDPEAPQELRFFGAILFFGFLEAVEWVPATAAGKPPEPSTYVTHSHPRMRLAECVSNNIAGDDAQALPTASALRVVVDRVIGKRHSDRSLPAALSISAVAATARHEVRVALQPTEYQLGAGFSLDLIHSAMTDPAACMETLALAAAHYWLDVVQVGEFVRTRHMMRLAHVWIACEAFQRRLPARDAQLEEFMRTTTNALPELPFVVMDVFADSVWDQPHLPEVNLAAPSPVLPRPT